MKPRFPIEVAGYRYRPLRFTTPMMRGYDVVAVQHLLVSAGYNLPEFGADGYAGQEFRSAVVRFQTANDLTADGIAGVMTKTMLVRRRVDRLTTKHELYPGLLRGQVEAESSNEPGNYTGQYSDGTRDWGIVMWHGLGTTDEFLQTVFNAPKMLERLAADPERGLASRFDKYRTQLGAKTERRAWELAAGSWNAPAWADTLARGGTLKPEQKAAIEGYIQRVSAYCVW